MNLDDIEGISKVDREGMLDVIEKFPEQVGEAADMMKSFPSPDFDVENVIITGMGGSAIGGEMIASLFKKESKVPIIVNRGYELPSFAGEKTLLVAASYSGNTEETLSCFEEAVERGCKTITISSGGNLEKESEKADFYIKIPGGMQPRAALAYLLLPSMAILEKVGITGKTDVNETVKVLGKLRAVIKKDVPARDNPAKRIASGISGIPLVYGHGILAVAARRWRQQLNENAKMRAFDFSVPEANHNELMSWEGNGGDTTCIFLRDSGEGKQIRKRFDYMKEVYGKMAKVEEIYVEGEDAFSRLMYAVYMGDCVSNYCAVLRDIDPTPVGLIQELKKKL